MSYLSLNFALFLAVLLIVYYLVPKNWMKQGVILIGNLFFCWWGGVSALVITLATTFVAYGAAILIERKYADYEKVKAELPLKDRVETFNEYKKKCRVYLYAALAVSIAIFAYVKLGRYLGWKVTGFKGFSFGESIIVPIGLSYYTFMLIGYVLDVYWDKAKAQHNYLKFLMCTTYFPHIISGPFSRLDKLGEQFEHLPKFEYRRFCFGMQLTLWGLFQKLVISEGLRIFVTTVKASIEARAGLELIITMVFGVLYSFTDFSGCMDMVRGISQAIGVELDENFRQPFFSKSISEFWRRWHITLGAWMRDYIFIPITRSRRFRRTGKKLGQKTGWWASCSTWGSPPCWRGCSRRPGTGQASFISCGACTTQFYWWVHRSWSPSSTSGASGYTLTGRAGAGPSGSASGPWGCSALDPP